MTTISKAGGQSINYSGRFTISGMTGQFPADVIASLKSVSGTPGPEDVPIGGAAQPTGGIGVPFNEQTGPIRYAPMPQVPPTSITAQDIDPLYPTSSVVIAKTYLGMPDAYTTQTVAQTFSVASHPNYVSFPLSKEGTRHRVNF
jgi:hypothetical protein